MEDYIIIHDGDHYAAYLDGKFICSGDTRSEVEKELKGESSQ